MFDYNLIAKLIIFLNPQRGFWQFKVFYQMISHVVHCFISLSANYTVLRLHTMRDICFTSLLTLGGQIRKMLYICHGL
jgi:hypothetical protein